MSTTETVTTTTTKFELPNKLEVILTDEVKNGIRKKTVRLYQYTSWGGAVYLDEEDIPRVITALRDLVGV